jgi:antitoxin HicB
MSSNVPHYSMVIEWSDDDQLYVVSLPEWGELAHTHGKTYTEAVKNGEEVLEMLVEHYQAEGRPLPRPKVRVS